MAYPDFPNVCLKGVSACVPSASIPLTLLQKSEDLQRSEKNIIACGFGVGLSWGSVYMTLDKIVCSELVEI